MFGFIFELGQDIRQSFRSIRSNPVSSAAVVGVFALGIAANTAMFAGFYAWVVRPLDFVEPERLVTLSEVQPKMGDLEYGISARNLEDWRQRASAFEGLSLFECHAFGFRARVDPERIEGVPGRPAKVALISDDLWVSRFEEDPDVIGRSLWLDNEVHEVIGVMKPGFEFPEWAKVWVPLGLEPSVHPRESHRFDIVGRLADGVSIEQARGEMQTVTGELEALYPETNRGWGVRILPSREKWAPPVIRLALTASLGAAFFVMLIICANVAGILLAQASSRSRETALRTALGASRRRLVSLAVTECTMLAALGGLCGLPLAHLFNQWMLGRAPIDPPYLFAMTVDYRAMVYTLGVALLTGAACAIAPVICSSRFDVFAELKSGGARLSAAHSPQRLRRALVVGELALSTALVIASFLMVRSFLNQQQVDPGHRVNGVMTAELSLSGLGFETPRERLDVLRRSMAGLRDLPSIARVGATSSLPVGDGFFGARVRADDQGLDEEATLLTKVQWVAGDYLGTLEIPVVDGRDFTQTEIDGRGSVALISSSLAGRLWPNEKGVVGRRLEWAGASDPWLTVVGVVGDVDAGEDMTSSGRPVKSDLYLPLGAAVAPPAEMHLVLVAEAPVAVLAPDVRQAIRRVNPGLPISEVRTMRRVVWEHRWVTRFFGEILTVYAILALAIAVLGAYGVCAEAVSQRTREIAVRSALGASRGDLVRFVMRQGVWMGALGLGLGFALAFGLTRYGASMLLGISPRDPLVFVSVAVLLGAVSLLASYLPARRAMRIDVVASLRGD